MPKQYCPSCGASNEYSLLASAPKFCSQCAQSLSSESVAIATVYQPKPVSQQAPAPKKPLLRAYREDDDDYEEDAPSKPLRVPRKLDIEIIEDAPTQKMTLGSIMRGTEDCAIVEKNGKRMPKRVRQEKLQEWRHNLQNVTRRGTDGATE